MSTGSKLVGYARCSTDRQDLTAQRNALTALGVVADRIYVDHGLPGTDRKRPGLRGAMAACHEGSTLVVTKLDRLARSVRDAGDIADELTRKEVKLSIGGSVHDPTDPVGKLLFNALAMIAEFEIDLSRLRTREGMKIAEAKGRLRGKQPKLCAALQKHLVQLYNEGGHTGTELAELLQVGRSTVYRTLARPANRRSRGLRAGRHHRRPAVRRPCPDVHQPLRAPAAAARPPTHHGHRATDHLFLHQGHPGHPR